MGAPIAAPEITSPDITTESSADRRRSGPQAALLITALLLGVLCFQLNASMITPALPDIGRTFGTSADGVAKVQSMFFLAGAIAGPVIGRWSDFLGRRRALLIVLATMTVGTLVCLLAPTLSLLIVGRFLQGFSSAVFGLSYMLLSQNLTQRLFGMSVGIIASVNGGVGGIDGFVGGLMTDRFGYRSIFAVVLVLTALAVVAILAIVPRDGAPRAEGRMDWRGAACLSVFLVFLTYVFSHGSTAGWTSLGTIGLALGAVIAFVAFWTVEKRGTSPLIATRHLKSRQVWPVIATTVLTLAGIFAIINFTVVLLSQDTHSGFGLDAATSALLFLAPSALIGVIAAPIAGWIADRRGWTKLVRTGAGLSAAAAAVAALVSHHEWALMICLATLGVFYYGLFLTAINGLSVLLSPKDAPAALPAVNGASFGIGASLGVVVVAPFAALGTQLGYTTALWISAGITVAAFAVSLLIPAPERSRS